MNVAVTLAFALVCMFAGVAAWFLLVLPVPENMATGTIMEKVFVPAEEVRKTITRVNRSFEGQPHEIKYTKPDRYVLRIRFDDGGGEANYAVTAPAAQGMEPGTAVRVTYIERYIPFWGKRIYVKDMSLVRPASVSGRSLGECISSKENIGVGLIDPSALQT